MQNKKEKRRVLRFLACAFQRTGGSASAALVRRFGFKFTALKRTWQTPLALAAIPAEVRSWRLLKHVPSLWKEGAASQEEVTDRGDAVKREEATSRLAASEDLHKGYSPLTQKNYGGFSGSSPQTMKKIKKAAKNQRTFRIQFWASLNRAFTAYFKKRVTCPITWLRFDTEPVKVAKFIFNVGLSRVLKNPDPPNPYPLEDYLPREALDRIAASDMEFAVVLSQMKRCMPLLPPEEVLLAKDKHKSCVTKPTREAPTAHLRWIRRITKWVFSPLRKSEWTVLDADFSESATFENKREKGGGKGETRCAGCEACEGQGKYHDKRKHWDSLMNEDQSMARVCAVNGNMKARIVTAHPAPLNFFRPLQQLLWTRLKSVPVFQYTGSMPTMATMKVFEPEEGFVFNSADYSCATDGINPQSTIAALEEIFKIVPQPTDIDDEEWERYQEQAKSTITASKLFYSITDFVQQNYGQMMGHLLSFPILNIVNAAIWAETMWESSELLLLELQSIFTGRRDFPLRINGDDLLCKMREEQCDFFAEVVSRNGWELSVGKSYRHVRYGCINSQFFDFVEKTQVGEKYKFGGLQKEATPDSLAEWLWKWKGEDDVEDFFDFFKDFFLRSYGHPRSYDLFRYFTPETQERLYSRLPSLTLRDFHQWQKYHFEQRARLREEDYLSRLFAEQNGFLLKDHEKGLVEEHLLREKEKKEWEKRKNSLYSLAAKFGVLTVFRQCDKTELPLPPWVQGHDPHLTVDRVFWSFVAEWRRTRLQVEEYSSCKEGSKYLCWTWRSKREKFREYKEWRIGMEDRRPIQKGVSEGGRFVVRDSDDWFYPHWGTELSERGFSQQDLRLGYTPTGRFVWSDDGRVCHVGAKPRERGWIIGGALDEQVARPGESPLPDSRIRLLLTSS